MGIAQCTPATGSPQTLTLVGQTLTLSGGGGSVTIPDLDTQDLSISGNVISLTNGGSVTLPPATVTFATPAETIAGTSTTLAVNPADLTAKLANQPASGVCTDREDVVWNGTILQGAAKHYSFSGGFASAYLDQPASTTYTPASADTTIVNPSSCRSLRVTIRDLASRMRVDSASASGDVIQAMSVTVGGTGVQYAIGAETNAGASVIYHSGSNSVGYGPTSGFYDIPPSASATFTVSEYLLAGNLNFISSGVHGASASFIAQTL
jgi:hypothetical protein